MSSSDRFLFAGKKEIDKFLIILKHYFNYYKTINSKLRPAFKAEKLQINFFFFGKKRATKGPLHSIDAQSIKLDGIAVSKVDKLNKK